MSTSEPNRRIDAVAGLAGVISVLLLVPAAFVVVLAGDYPAPDDPIADVIAYFKENETLFEVALFLEAVSLGVTVWFFGGLQRILSRGTEQPSELPAIAFGAGLGFVLLTLVQDAALMAAANVAQEGGSESGVNALWEFAFLVDWPFARPVLTASLIAVGVSAFRTGTLPRHIAVLAIIGAAANAAFIPSIFVDSGPYVSGGLLAHVIASLIFELWVLLASFAILRRTLFATRPPAASSSRSAL